MQNLIEAGRSRAQELRPMLDTVGAAAGAAAGAAGRKLSRTPGMAAAFGRAAPRRGRALAGRHPVLLGAGLAIVAAGGLLAIPQVRSALQDASRRVTCGLKSRFGRSAANGADGAAPPELKVRQEELLDEGIEESFPASDPVSVKRIT
jgi:hypothetical protein